MYAMDVISDGVLGDGDDIDGSAPAVNHWSRSDADLRSYLAAAAIIAGHLAGQCSGSCPEGLACASADAVAIDRENPAVLGRHVQHLSLSDTRNRDLRD